jgi:nucleotide-binding universal stress UspA family protein
MYKDILLAVDLAHDESWKKSVPTVIEYAKAFGSTLHVVTVVPDFGMSIVAAYFPKDHEEKALAECKEKLHAFTKEHIPDGIKVQHIIACGTAYEEILNLSKKIKCDLIVLGSHRPKAQDFFLGPNSARIVRHADCSVLVVRE